MLEIQRKSPRLFSAVSVGLSSIFVALALSVPFFWFLAPFAFGIFLYDVWFGTHTWRGTFMRGFIFALASGGASIFWFWDTLPLDWLGIAYPPYQWFLVFASWGFVIVFFGIVNGAFAILLRATRESPATALVTAFLWVLQEEGRMWSFAILNLGKQSPLGPHFSTSSLGYALTENHYTLQIADFGGIINLNFAVALMGALIALLLALWIRPNAFHTKHALAVGAVFLLVVAAVPFVHPSPLKPIPKEMNIGLVATDIPIGTTRIPAQRYLDILASLASSTVPIDVAVLSEENGLVSLFPDPEKRQKKLQEIFGSRDVLVMSSGHVQTPDGLSLSLAYDSTQNGVIDSYSKIFLMPGGEYPPYIMTAVFSILGNSRINQYMTQTLVKRISHGHTVVAAPFEGSKIGGLLCSDILSPVLYRELVVAKGANVLVNIGDPSWFHHSRLLYMKTVEAAKMHAVQNRTYLVQAADGAPSFAIDPYGNIIAESPWNWKGTLMVHIPQTP